MRLRNVILSILLLLSILKTAKSQSMYGNVLGNYAGVNSIQMNPSALHNSKTWLDIEFLGVGVFLQNNYLYLPTNEYKFAHFFQSGYEWPTHSEGYGTEVRNFYHYENMRPKNMFVNTMVMGPGAMLIWGKHAFAITTSFRNVVSLRK